MITRVALNMTAWDPTPRRLTTDGRIVRLGRFHTLDTRMISVSRARQDKDINLLVIPPQFTMAATAMAMTLTATSRSMA
jgi:Family of unknown function (DUF5994)